MIAEIREKLEALRALDARCKLSGASKHRYISTPVSESDIRAFETAMGMPLPGDYRAYINQIGYGAGPHYGLYSLEHIKKDYPYFKNRFFDEVEEENAYGEIARFSDLTHAHVTLYIDLYNQSTTEYLSYIAPTVGSVEGALVITEDGCTYHHLLVVAGELKDTIWDVSYESGFSAIPEGVFVPEAYEVQVRNGVIIKHQAENRVKCNGRPFSFQEWINNWLDDSLVAATKLSDQ